MTLRTHTVHGGLQMTNGTLTLTDALFQEAYICASVGSTSPGYNSRPNGHNFNAELVPVHSPLLGESCLVSHPPLTYMLKFSGFADLTSCPWLPKRLASHTQHAMHRNSDRGRSPISWLLAPAMPGGLHASGSRTWRTDFRSQHPPKR